MMITLAILFVTIGCVLFVLGCLGLIAQVIVPVVAGLVVVACLSYLFRQARIEREREEEERRRSPH